MCALVTGVLTCALPISCTGTGESFIRVGFGSEVDAQIRYRETTLANATAHALDAVAMLGGRGGCIAIDARGKIRSEERRVGNKCVRSSRSRWSPHHSKKTNQPPMYQQYYTQHSS